MAGLRFIAIATGVLACACVEPALEYELPPVQQTATFLPPVDTFWLQQSIAERNKPPPAPVRSISLGYVGDAPLTGGVMRDTPMDFPR